MIKDNDWILTRFCAILIFTGFLYSGCLTAQNADSTRILFVGNSYTYFWNLPQQVEALAAASDVPISTRQSTSGGFTLGQHWRGEKGTRTIELIKSGQFDIVVLQDHSMRSSEHPDSLLYYGHKFADLIRENGGKPYLYMTWARAWDPFMLDAIDATYTQLGKEIDAVVAPVGRAWRRAGELRPDLNLYDPDQSHPSPVGTYLTACVFYGVLTGKSPVGLPDRLLSTDKDGETIYLNILPGGDAQFCQNVADEVINLHKD